MLGEDVAECTHEQASNKTRLHQERGSEESADQSSEEVRGENLSCITENNYHCNAMSSISSSPVSSETTSAPTPPAEALDNVPKVNARFRDRTFQVVAASAKGSAEAANKGLELVKNNSATISSKKSAKLNRIRNSA